MIIVSRFVVPRGYLGVAVFPFVFLKNSSLRKSKTLINHERIHLQQQKELLVVPFFIFYLFEFAIRLSRYRNIKKAYRNISFEREAYRNEHVFEYLNSRKFWQFISYL